MTTTFLAYMLSTVLYSNPFGHGAALTHEYTRVETEDDCEKLGKRFVKKYDGKQMKGEGNSVMYAEYDCTPIDSPYAYKERN